MFHGWWVLASFAVLIFVIAILIAVRRWSTSTRARQLGGVALWTLIAGQILGTASIFVAHFVMPNLSPGALRWMGYLNIAAGVGMVLTILSLLLTVLALVAAIRHR